MMTEALVVQGELFQECLLVLCEILLHLCRSTKNICMVHLHQEFCTCHRVLNEEGSGLLGHLKETVSNLGGVVNINAAHLDAVAKEMGEVIVNGDWGRPTKQCG